MLCLNVDLNFLHILTPNNRNLKEREWCKRTRFGFRKKRRINSVRVNCVRDLFELFEDSQYSKNFLSVAQC